MKTHKWGWVIALGMLSGGVCAQELRCTQIFMNASEKRICATPALMQLDEQMGELARRAAMHQDTFRSDQRAFRKALKSCDGDGVCLASFYQKRIADLQAFVDALPPPTDQEAEKLADEGQEAQEKRDAQADTRERIAEKLQKADPATGSAPANATTEVPPPSVPEEKQTITEPATEAAEPAVAPAATVEEPQPVKPQGDKPGWGTWAIIALILLGIVVAFFDWLYKAVRRCPKCTKWWAGQVYDRDRESYTDYETREFVDEHRNRNNVLVGTTRKKRQVAIRVSKTTDYLRCELCKHEWVINSTSRSS